MPCAVDYILEGLADNLELERELGNFAVDFDRGFLAKLPTERAAPTAPAQAAAAGGGAVTGGRGGRTTVEGGVVEYDFVFLHDRPFTGASAELMTKAIAAMGKTPETAPIIHPGVASTAGATPMPPPAAQGAAPLTVTASDGVPPPVPPAKIRIVLGAKALRLWYPGVSIGIGGWFKDVDCEVIYVSSPDEIYRFGTTPSPALQAKKKALWESLKEVMRKKG